MTETKYAHDPIPTLVAEADEFKWKAYRFFTRLRRTPRSAVNSVVHAWQRVVRGWDDASVWSLDTEFTRTLSQQLEHLAHIMHGWPAGEEFPEFEDWQNALLTNSARLGNYAHRWEGDDENYGLLSREAEEALHWVADHLGHLWD